MWACRIKQVTLHIVTSDGVSFPLSAGIMSMEIQTQKRFKRTQFIMAKHSTPGFGVIAFIKLQNSFLKDCPENSHVVIFPNK